MKHKIRHLKKRDKILARVISQVKLAPTQPKSNHFRSLVEGIINQQLSTKAADTITKRFIALFPKIKTGKFPTPNDILKTKDSVIRSAGISGQKISYIKNIARAELDFKKMNKITDEEVILELTKIKGIGRWTARPHISNTLQPRSWLFPNITRHL